MNSSKSAIMRDLFTAWKLLWNPRVPTLLKLLLPVMATAYWIFPLDLMPGFPLDDAAVMILALKLFVMLAPQDIVEQTRSGHSTSVADDDENTINTTWSVVEE